MNKTLEENTTIDVLTSGETSRLAELEAVVDQHKDAVLNSAMALKEIKEGRLYRASHPTFEAYVKERFTWTRQSGYRLIELAEVHENVSPEGYKVTKAAARVLAPLEPEQQQKVYQFIESATGSKKPSTEQVKAVAELVQQIDASGVVEDPETGEHVEFSALPAEKQAAIIRENVTTNTHERMERQKAHIEEKQQAKEQEKETLSSLAARTWQEWLETYTLNNPHLKVFMELEEAEGRASYQFKVMNRETRQMLYSGEPKPWMKAAAFGLIEVLK